MEPMKNPKGYANVSTVPAKKSSLLSSATSISVLAVDGSYTLRNTISVSFSVTEECPEGTLVGQLGSASIHSSPQFPSVDPTLDAGRQFGIRYQLLTRTEIFRLDEFSGAIFTSGRIDRETLCIEKQSVHRSDSHSQELPPRHRENTDLPCFVNLQILQVGNLLRPILIHKGQTAEPESTEPTVILVRIFILDVNDNAPSWPDSEINISVPEHTPAGTQFALPLAHDADCGPENTTVRYLILKPLTDFAFDQYKTRDYELHRLFQLDAELTDPFDADRHPSFADSKWSVDVIGRGASPISACMGPSFRLWLRIVGDIDYETSEILQPLQQKQYSLFSSRNWKNTQEQVKPVYSFILAAVDGGRPVPKTGTVVVNVNVKDINDHAPIFLPPDDSSTSSKGSTYTRLKTPQSLQTNSVFIELQENAPVGEILYVPKVFEPDSMDQAGLVFEFDSSIDIAAKKFFSIHSKSGTVRLKSSPDYEKHISFLLPIRVSDGKHTAHQSLHVEILNLNDNAPVITVRPVNFPSHHNQKFNSLPMPAQGSTFTPIQLFIEENQPPGQFIASVSVSDDDQQAGSSSILDRDNAAAGLPDSDLVNAFYCQLSQESLSLEPLFHGAFDQFKLLTRISFDREQTPEHLLTLTCADSGQPRQSSRVSIELVILDRNDNSPLIKNTPLVASVRENSPPERRIFRVEASDADTGKNAVLRYALSGEGAEKFRINPKTGEIVTAETFDRETTARFNLIVTVKDRQTNGTLSAADAGPTEPVKETTAVLTVEVQDENDCVPTFYQSLYQFTVEENSGISTVVGEVKAKDEDVMPENHKIIFSMKAEVGNPAMADFRITSDGRIFVERGNLDRETISSYTFTVIASDTGNPPLSSTAQVQIHISDVNDNAPTWLFPPDSNLVINMTIYEPVGYQVAQFRATDRDYAENGDVVYQIVHFSILSSTNTASVMTVNENVEIKHSSLNTTGEILDGSPFELDSSTGALYVARALSIRDMGLVKITVEACDLGTPPKSAHRTILFNILDYYRPQKVPSSSTGSYEDTTQENMRKATYRSFEGQDIVIVTVMIAVAIFIALFLIVAIIFLQCPICRRPRRGANHQSSSVTSNHKVSPPAAGFDLQYSVPPDAPSYYYLPEVFRDSHSLISLVGNGNRAGDTTAGKDGSLGSSAYSYDGHDDISGDTVVYPAILQLSQGGQSAATLEASKVPISAVQSGIRLGDISGPKSNRLSVICQQHRGDAMEAVAKPFVGNVKGSSFVSGSSSLSYSSQTNVSANMEVLPSFGAVSALTPSKSCPRTHKNNELDRRFGALCRFSKKCDVFQQNLPRESTTPKNKGESIKLLPLSTKLEGSQVMFIDKPKCSSLESSKRVIEESRSSEELAAELENNEVHKVKLQVHQKKKCLGAPVPPRRQPTISWMEPESRICIIDNDTHVNFELQEGCSNQTGSHSRRCESRSDLEAGNGYTRLGRSQSISYDDLVHVSTDESGPYTDLPNTVI
ncbi:Protocadherin-9 [Sparganum proliferum]